MHALSPMAVITACLSLPLPIVVAHAAAQAVSPKTLPTASGLMLAKENQSTDGSFWLSEKLDGIRALWNGQQLHTRSGRPIHAPSWFTEQFPAVPLDGELWLGRGAFQKLMRVVMDQVPDESAWSEVRFYAFDLPMEPGAFEHRYQQLLKHVAHSPSLYLKAVQQELVKGHAQIQARLMDITAKSGEGVMLRTLASPYESGRSGHLQKLKPIFDAEATVVGYKPGSGKYQGLMGSLILENDAGKRFHVGTGFTVEERRHPPAIGSQISYRYRGLTDSGLPRLASYWRIKQQD